MKRLVLLNVGPCVVPEKVRIAMLQPDSVHREPEFFELLTDIREKLTKTYKADENYKTVIVCGSGTSVIESTISSVIRKGKLLVVSNGYYGEKIANIAQIHGIDTEILGYKWGDTINVSDVKNKLNSDSSINYVAMVHTETSTGILNDLDEMGDLVSDYGKTFIVDAIASVGSEDVDVIRSKIDFCLGSPNKCIESVPGVAMVCCNKQKLEALKDLPPKTSYLDLYSYYKYEEGLGARTGTPFTPPVQVFYAFDEALNLLLKEGISNRRKRYEKLANLVRDGMDDLGFKLYLPRDKLCSCITPVSTPKNITYQTIHDEVKEDGYIIYAGLGNIADLFFRIGNMGQLTTGEMKGFLRSVRSILEEQNITPKY